MSLLTAQALPGVEHPLPGFAATSGREASVAPGADVSVWQAAASPALQQLRSHQGPVLVDLDQTLYLRNSTEDFLDTARPAWVALLLLALLELLKPWRWTGGEVTRDAWRVQTIACLLPWTRLLWRRRVGALAHRHLNRPLMSVLLERSSAPVMTSAGLRLVVLPLISALGMSGVRVVCPRGTRDARRGLARLCQEALGHDWLNTARVVSAASFHPAPVSCDQRLFVGSAAPRLRRALGWAYYPGRYLMSVKRTGASYISRGILQEDFAFWLLASIGFATLPALHVLGLLFLLLSFWSVYEQGHVDHDRLAARKGPQAKPIDAYGRWSRRQPRYSPWLWAAASAVIAFLLLHGPQLTVQVLLYDVLAWAAVLIATYSWFLLYNRHSENTRLWLYPGLQLARAASFAVVVKIGPIGAIALAAHVLARWLPYWLYRHAPQNGREAPFQLVRLVMFTIGAMTLALAMGPRFLLTPPALALAGWNIYRARHELQDALRHARRADQEGL